MRSAKKLLHILEKFKARLIVFLLGKKMWIWIYPKSNSRNEKWIGIVDQYSGMYYGVWRIVTDPESEDENAIKTIEVDFIGF